jgi:PAS domain-containing protein
MHYTGMAAATFLWMPGTPLSEEGIRAAALGGGAIVVVTFLVLILALAGAYVDRRLAAHALALTAADATGRRHAESELIRSEDRYRSLAEAIPQMVWAATTMGDVDYYSARWFEYTGNTPEQIYASGWNPLIHPRGPTPYCTERRSIRSSA